MQVTVEGASWRCKQHGPDAMSAQLKCHLCCRAPERGPGAARARRRLAYPTSGSDSEDVLGDFADFRPLGLSKLAPRYCWPALQQKLLALPSSCSCLPVLSSRCLRHWAARQHLSIISCPNAAPHMQPHAGGLMADAHHAYAFPSLPRPFAPRTQPHAPQPALPSHPG